MEKREGVVSKQQIKQENTHNPRRHKCCVTPLSVFFFLSLISPTTLIPFSSSLLSSVNPSSPTSLVSFPYVLLTLFNSLRLPSLSFFFPPLDSSSAIDYSISSLHFSLYSILAAHHYTGRQTLGVSSVHGNMPPM